jgi:hypothetical protein
LRSFESFGVPTVRVFQAVFQLIQCKFLEYRISARGQSHACSKSPFLRSIDQGVKAASKYYVFTDSDGLQLQVRSNGPLWNFNYREPVTKKRINIGIGTYPEPSLANARKMAVEARELLAQGVDPKMQRNTLNEAKRAETEHTFENVATAWFELTKDSVTPAYAEDIWRSLTLHVLPDLKTTPLVKITAPMVI